MPWTKYEVEGKYRKGIVRILAKCILDNGDSDGKDSYPGGPDEYGFRIIRPCRCVKCRDNVAQDKRHAPVPDDEINLGEPSRGRLRIAAMSQRRGEELRAEMGEDSQRNQQQQRVEELRRIAAKRVRVSVE